MMDKSEPSHTIRPLLSEEEDESTVVGYPAVGIVQGIPLSRPFPSTSRDRRYPVMPPPLQWDSRSVISSDVPRNAITQNYRGLPIQETFYGDTPAPFRCVYCDFNGVTTVKSTIGLPAWVACLVTMVGFCFLCTENGFQHKHHFCPNCQNEVAVFFKKDACMIMDPKKWWKQSYAFV